MMNTGDKNLELILKEYELLINDLHHIHNIQHSLMRYTIPFIAASIGLTKDLAFPLFGLVIALLILFATLIWIFYERLDYLIAIKFTRLIDIEKKYLNFMIFQNVKNPTESIKKKYKIGYKISMIRLYRWSSIITIITLILMLIVKWSALSKVKILVILFSC